MTTEVFTSGTTIDYVDSTAIPTGATLVSTITARGASGAAILDIPAGTATFGAGTTGGRRVYFAVSEYPDVAGVDFELTANAEQILDNILHHLA